MDINEESLDLIQNAIKSYIKELCTTKKGKHSYRKYKKNRVEVFRAVSLAADIDMEKNEGKIEQAITDYINQFADVKEMKLGEPCEFVIGSKLYSENKESLKCPHIEYKIND